MVVRYQHATPQRDAELAKRLPPLALPREQDGEPESGDPVAHGLPEDEDHLDQCA